MSWFRALFVALFLFTAEVNATPLITRTATVNKPFQILAWANIGYNQTNQTYNWGTGNFEKLPPTVNTLSAELTASVGLPGKLELGGVLPVMSREQEENHSAGIGDLFIIGRYGVLQNPPLPVRAALALGVSLPTGNKETTPRLGDGSTDIGFGLTLNTIKLAFITAHLRAAYWFNGKTDDTTKLGNMLEYMAGLDFPVLPKLTPQIAFSGCTQEKKRINGVARENSELSRGMLNLLLLYKPLPLLTVRPKLALPLKPLCKGDRIADLYPGLDIWVTVP